MQQKVIALCLRVQFFLANPVFQKKIKHVYIQPLEKSQLTIL